MPDEPGDTAQAGATPVRPDPQPPASATGSAVLARGYAVRLGLFFTALFLVAGTKLPYFPLWLDWRGLDKSGIAIVTAAPLLLRIVSGPLIALAADRWGDRRQVAILLSVLSLACLAAMNAAPGFWAILAASLVMALTSNALMPLAETLAMAGVRLGGLDYGRMRLWGSLSFVAAGFVAGSAIRAVGPASVLWLMLAAAATTLLAALVLPPEPVAPHVAGVVPAKRFSAREAATMMTSTQFLVFLLAAACVQSSHAVFYTFGVIDWQRQGLGSTWSAGLWAIGVAAEIALFAFSRPIVHRLGPQGLILAGAAGGVVRWTAMAFDPPLALLWPLQALHGLTFGAAHLGALHFMAAHVPPAAASTAQALYASVTAGIGLALATLAAGPLYAAVGSRSYFAMAVLAAIGWAASYALARDPKGRREARAQPG